HSGQYGGAAPDAVAALIAILASLRDEDGNTTITGLDASGTWSGSDYDEATFRTDAGMLEGTDVLGSGSIADMLWARPAVTVLGIDAPSVTGAVSAIQPRAGARLNLRVPPGTDPAEAARLLEDHLHRVAPWGVRVRTETIGLGAPFAARTDTAVFDRLSRALGEAFGTRAITSGMGGAI